MGLLIRRAELVGRAALADVRVEGEQIAEVAPTLTPTASDDVVDAAGAAVIPGLADHHVHLLSWAASLDSIHCGPPQVADRAGLARALRDAPRMRDGWIRGVGYHESVAGLLERAAIDDLERERPVRIQHRSGMLWMLNSEGLRQLGLDTGTDPGGVERDRHGRATGRCWNADGLLGARLPRQPLDLTRVGHELLVSGVTSVTDATATTDAESVRALERAVARGELRQHVTVMGPADLELSGASPLRLGPAKLVLHEGDLPDLDHTVELVATARAVQRPVAFHCTTRVELVFAMAVLETAGSRYGDRIEHGGVVPPELHDRLRAGELTVVTQPNFVAERGDQYLREVDSSDRPHLYPCASLLSDGIRVGAGTDAPFGDPDPWRAIDAAQQRRTAHGVVLGARERVDGDTALALFLGRPDDPGGPPRRIARGEPADLCILTRPLGEIAATQDGRVAVTVIGGVVAHAA